MCDEEAERADLGGPAGSFEWPGVVRGFEELEMDPA